MANLDTPAKRRAGASWLRGIPGLGGYGPEPDGDLANVQDRMDMAGDYRGILPATGKRNNGLLLGVYRYEN